MAAIASRNSTIRVSTDGITYTALGKVSDYDVSHDGETIEITNNDSSGYKEFLGGLSSATISVSFFYDEADAGQDIVRTSNEGRTTIYYEIRPGGAGVGNREIIWQGIITSMSDPSGSTSGAAECSIDVQCTGSPTIQDQ